jgi:hypothetical protein
MMSLPIAEPPPLPPLAAPLAPAVLAIIPPLPAAIDEPDAPATALAPVLFEPPLPATPVAAGVAVVAVVPPVLVVAPRPAVAGGVAVVAPLPPTAAFAPLPPVAADAGLPALVVPAAPVAGNVVVLPGDAAVESFEFEQPVNAQSSANTPQEKRISCMARSVRSAARASTRTHSFSRETAIF